MKRAILPLQPGKGMTAAGGCGAFRAKATPVCLRWLLILFAAGAHSLSLAQLDENCTVSILNRSVQVQPDGTWGIPNVPVEPGYFRVRVSCTTNGVTYGGQSEYFLLISGSPSTVRNITLGALAPLPVALTIASPKNTMTTRGETVQMTAEAAFADGTTADVTELAAGTFWSSSNPQIADVSSNGLVTARSRGLAIIQARNEGVLASFSISILIPNDADGDGMTDEFERANGLNPNDSTDAAQDPDTDGLTSLQEFQRGTNPRAADTDTDGVADGAEVLAGTNPLRADSDSDGLSDGAELVRGTNPLNNDSDGDGIPDGLELQLGLDPAVANATTRVEGRVVDPLGAPIQGASVTVFSALVASSDATGFFAIDGVPATEGPLTALAQIVRAGQIYDGMSSATAPVSGGVTAMGTIQLQLNAGTVSGLVTGPLGDPVPGALVTITAGADSRTATTDGAGRYRVRNMTAGSLLVSVRDPRSGLRGRATGALLLNQSAVVNVELGPRATITGTVFERDGVTPVLPGATVRLSGIASAVTQTDPLGRYLFDFVPLGSYAVEASDAANNRGRTSGELTATAQVNVSDVTYLGRGTVTGVVRDGGGNPVANASVSLSSGSVFGGRGDVTSGADGRFTFLNVFIGPFQLTARAPIARLGGQAAGMVESEGQSVTADVTLVAAGTLAGTVFRPDGATPVPNAAVTVSPGGLGAVTDGQGRYRFEFMPVGSYTVDALDPGTGDRGRAGGSISSQDETRTVNVTLIGQGTVVVTVRDGGGQLVPGARVTFSSFSIFGGSRSGNTAADGSITFGAVPAADFSVSASDPATGLAGAASGTVAVDGTTAVTVNLQGAGSIAGRVFAADGTTPVAGILVRASGPRGRDTRTDADGVFRFDIMPTGTYTVDALDGRGNLRARAGGVAVTEHGQVVSANLTLIGVGTVGGLVRHPDSTPAAGIAVSLDTDAPGFGSLFFTQTDVEGRYSIGDVPLGTFTVTASGRQGDLQLFGVAASQVANHGDNVTVNVMLSGTLIPINPATATLYDANNFIFDLLRGGEIQDGMRQVYGGDFNANRGAALLEVVVNGISRRFGGSGFGTTEEGGRELVLGQTGVNGLDVTRKIYVPCDGYFARYLEILSNNTANAIVAGVRVSSHFRFINKVQGGFNFSREPRVISTSSGDTTVGVGDPGSRDRWAVIDDDDDGDPFLLNTLPAVADVFDGPGGAVQAASAGYTVDFTQRFGRLVTEWASLTVPPGGAVAILHFAAQQTSRGSARASAERLVQLPPEALAGLSSSELALIQNFDVPPDGVSALPALPPLTGTVNGRVLSGDGSNAMAGVAVRLRSNSPFYGRTHFFNANGAGAFSRIGRVPCNGSSTPLPADDFTLVAVNPWSGRDSAPVMGSFQPGLLTAEQDIVFADTGNLAGTVRRHSGVVVSSGSVRISGGLLLNTVSAAIAADGTYRVIGLPEGLYTLVATVPVAQGSDLIGSASANLMAGETFLADIAIEETGTLTGIVRRNGVVLINLLVQLRGPDNLSRSTRTDTGGRYTFNDVPSGPVTVEAFDSASNTAASEDVTVLTDQTVTRDLALTVGGTVEGLVTAPNNQPVEGAQVALTGTSGTFNTATDATGRYRFARVTPGNVSVAVFDPVSLRRGRASGSLGLSGQTLTLNVRLLDAGSVTGLVLRADGVTPVAGAAVSISGSTFASTTSDAGGGYRFDFVPIGSFTLDVTDAATGDRGRAVNQVNAVGETRTVNVVMNGQGRVNVIVRDASGNTVENARVSVTSQTVFGGTQQGNTGPDGQVTFERVLAGTFFVTANHPLTTLSGSTNGSVAVGGEANVTVRLQAAGTILGLVLGPDGATPVGGANVRLVSSFFGVIQQVSSAADGSFRFDAVPLGTYQLEARDNSNRLRARETNVRLQANGDTASRNLVFVGLGAVAGRVLNPDSSPAPGVRVSVRSTHPLLGGFFNATSGAEGQYSVAGVPVGGFTATATDTGRQLQGETVGQISQDGQTVTADIQLVSNAINLPVNWYDGNNFYFDVQGNGSVANGYNSVFAGDFGVNRGASLLDVVQGGNTNRFTAGSVGASEDGGREVAVRQTAVAGLNVTRKVFVPRDGYFARYLEVLENPTADGITVDVQVLSHYRPFFNNPRLIETSTGDNTLDVSDPANPDRWVVIDDGNDGDPFTVGGLPAVVSVFDGPGASRRANAASFAVVNGVGQLRLRWNGVTVPPGGSVMLMHFLVQQVNRAAGGEAGRRLVQLPPEALTGLSATEIAAVGNFMVPLDGLGMVAPLPALNGRISGRVLAEDATTPLPFGGVRFRSEHPLFGRVHFLNSDGNGMFQVSPRLGDFGDTVLVPVDRYAIEAIHPTTSITTTNRFQFPTTPTPLMGNLSALIGTASASSFFPGWPPSRAIDDNLNTSWFTASGDAANRGTTPFLEVLLSPPADVTQINIRGNRESANGFDFFRGRIDVFGAGGGVLHSETVDLPAPVRDLDLDIPDQAGVQRVRFTGLADESADPGLAELAVLGTVGVTNRAQSDVIFNNTGGIAGTVRRADGTPVGATCSIQISGSSSTFFFSSAADGTFVMNGLLPGNYTVTAFLNDPTGTALTGNTNATVAVGQVTVRDVVLEPSGALEGTVVSASGVPASNVFLQLFRSGFNRSVRTDANGRYLFTNVRTGLFTLQVFEPGSQVSSNYAVTIVADQTNRQDIALIGLGTIQLQVNFASGSPVPNLNVELQAEARGAFFFFAGRTDSAGRLTLANVPVGRFVVRTPHPSNGNVFTDTPGVITMNGDVIMLTATLPGTGVVMGRVNLADGSPAAGSTVRLIHTNFNQQTSTDSAGNYTVTQVPAERPFTLRAFLPGNSQIFRDLSNNIVPADGATLAVDVTLPAIATLRVTVLRSGGAPFVGARVNLRHAFQTSLRFVGVTDASGVLSVANVPEGPFYVEARDPSSFAFAGSATGAIALADQGRTVDVTITAPPLGTVQGTVLAGDGATPVPGSYIEIFDAASGQLVITRGTDLNGMYRADGLASGAAGFRVVAHSPNRFEIRVEASGSITNTGDVLTLDLTMPISVVTGHVYYHDGATPVPFPNVTATFTSTNGNQYFFGSSFTDENGMYRILDVEQGAAFTLNGRDPQSGLPGLATGLVETVSVPLTVDVLLLPSGTVAGMVEDAAMNAVPFAQVVLRSSSLDTERFLETDENGSFQFDRVPLGDFILQACTFGGGKLALAAGNLKPAGGGGGGNEGICGLTNGTVSVPDEVVNINVQLPPTATVQGTVYAADGTTPVPFAQVIIQNFDHRGPLGFFETYRQANENGQYPETRVPLGTVRVTASDPENFQSAGYAQRAVGPDERAIVDVILGNAIRFDYRLIGADGFVYDVNCNGELGDGGTEDGRLNDAYDGAYELQVEDSGFPCFATGLLEEEGREVIIGPGGFADITITRKVFVPAAGGFARFLEILSNPAAVDRTVRVRLDSNLGSDGSTTVVVAPSETTNTYAVTRENRGESSDPALAHVAGGLNAAVTPDNWFLQEGEDDLVVEWTVTVPAGGRAILMHFAVQREPTDAAGAETQARALVDLSEPEAMTGMSVEERAEVVNFNVPSLLPGSVSPRMRLALTREAGWLRFDVRGTQGRLYVLEASSDLVHWTPLEAVESGDGQIVLPELMNGGQSRRFYRARLVE